MVPRNRVAALRDPELEDVLRDLEERLREIQNVARASTTTNSPSWKPSPHHMRWPSSMRFGAWMHCSSDERAGGPPGRRSGAEGGW